MNYLETNNMEKLGVDLLSFNSSKIGGPKGVGVLYKKRGVELAPLYGGGGQEFGLRSGTENVSGIVGVAEALEQVCKIKEKENKRLTILRDYTIEKLLELGKKSGYQIKLNGDKENRLPNNINISVSGISSELLVIELDAKGIFVSEKSACHSEKEGVSHVIKAIREAEKMEGKTLGNDLNNSLRISLGQQITCKDMDYFIASLEEILNKYKEWK
jgi:cysteine desulfurase